jgi:signal transduction histidine kinase
VKEVEQLRRETAADFHDELGHKLTIISWFAEILKKKIGPEQQELRPHLDRIIEASGNLYHTMKDMLWAMDPDKDSVYDLYSQIKEFGLELFDNTGVEFEASEIPVSLKEHIISPAHKRHVLLIFKEVMHNSLKHASGNATTLDFDTSKEFIRFRFRDNGKGFKMNGQSVGRGLENVKRRALQIHASIKIHSEGTGTVAELDIPIEHLN